MLAKSNFEMENIYDLYAKNIRYSGSIHLNEAAKVADENNQILNLKSLFDSSVPKLVFRIGDEFCNECIEDEIQALTNLGKVIGDSNIVIISSFKNSEYLDRLKIVRKIPFAIYNAKHVELWSKPVDITAAYFFMMNKDLIAHSIFIPTYKTPSLSKGYYKLVAESFNYTYNHQ